MRRIVLKIFIPLTALFLMGSLAQAKPPYPVFGYLATWNGGITLGTLPWNDMTHVMEAFARPNADGTIFYPAPGQRPNLVNTAHGNFTRCMLSVGGAGDSNPNWQSATGPAFRTAFVNNLMQAVTVSGYDGVDIDWEFPVAGDQANFMAFMSQLSTALRATNGYDSQPRQLTMFISPGYYICGVNWATIGSSIDYGILSGYDYGLTSFNGPLDDNVSYTNCAGVSVQGDIIGSVNRLSAMGFPKNQLILGIPLYSTNGYNVEVVLGAGTPIVYYPNQKEADYTYMGTQTGVNTAQSFCDKMNWAFSQGPSLAGIAMWEISEAYPTTANTGVSQIWAAIGYRDGCVTFGGPTPTPSFTPTLTHTRTPTNTRTFTFTFTATRTPSFTPTVTASFTHTLTPTLTNSFTPSFTPTSTFSFTPTTTGTLSPTDTSTLTPTRTPTQTATLTFTLTATNSSTPSFTSTLTNSATPTASPTFTPSATHTSTATPTFTLSPFPTFTPTLTLTPTPTQTVLVTGPPVISPNPANGPGPVTLYVPLKNPDSVEVKLFTMAYRKVNEKSSGQVPAGVLALTIDLTDRAGTPLANGVYYLVVQSGQGRNICKLLVLR